MQTPVPNKAITGDPNVWYLRYRDRDGQWCKSRATALQLRERLRDGQIPATVEVSRLPAGEFLALAQVAEFRDLAPAPTPTPPAPKPAKAAAHPPSQLLVDLQALVDQGKPPSQSWKTFLTTVIFLLLAAGSGAAFFYFNR